MSGRPQHRDVLDTPADPRRLYVLEFARRAPADAPLSASPGLTMERMERPPCLGGTAGEVGRFLPVQRSSKRER
jgi:hypothetical protein